MKLVGSGKLRNFSDAVNAPQTSMTNLINFHVEGAPCHRVVERVLHDDPGDIMMFPIMGFFAYDVRMVLSVVVSGLVQQNKM